MKLMASFCHAAQQLETLPPLGQQGSMIPASIRPATLADLPRVRELAYRIWPEAFAGVLPADRIGPMLDEIYALDTLRADIAERGHSYWLAGTADADLGFASAYRADGRVWIKKLYLLAESRGLGLGKELIASARAHLGAELPVALFVNDGNARAIGFYRSQGFEVESHVPVQMGPFQFTDYVMVKPS
jgi:ribosomal protein S18 acetylase RimI-like enzyme